MALGVVGAQVRQHRVTETFDYNDAEPPKMLELFRQPARNATGITKSLRGLATRFGQGSPADQ